MTEPPQRQQPNARSNGSSGIAAPAALIIAVAVLWGLPLLLWDRLFVNVDLQTHLRWAAQFGTALREGTLIPRWAPLSHHGLGDPTFLYYPPLFYYVVAALDLLVRDTWLAVKLAAVLGNAMTGAISLLLLRRWLPPGLALAAAIFAQATPLHFFLAYSHNALPWQFAFAFVLWLLGASFTRPAGISVSLATAALALTHVLSAFMALLCIGLAQLALRPAGGMRERLPQAVRWSSYALLGLALAGFYLVPALATQALINASGWHDQHWLDWRNAFMFPTWTAAAHGTRWWTIQWLLPSVAAAGLLLATLTSRHLARASATTSAGAEQLVGITASGLIALALGSELAYPLYLLGTGVQAVQWPYRFATVAAACSTLAVALVANLSLRQRLPARYAAGALGVASLSLACWAGLYAHVTLNGRAFNAPAGLAAGAYGQPEYHTATRGRQWEDYVRGGGLAAHCSEHGARCEAVENGSHQRRWMVTAPRELTVVLPVFAFPAWRVTVDGANVHTSVDPSTGLIALQLPAGQAHEVTLQWARLPEETAGLLTSALALPALVMLGLRQRRIRH